MPDLDALNSLVPRIHGGEFSPVGAAHTALSRQTLHENAQRPDLNQIHSDRDLWKATVRQCANRAAWVTRQGAKPLTTLIDAAMGTSRPERGRAGAGVAGMLCYGGAIIPAVLGVIAGGVSGAVLGVVTMPVGLCITPKWVRNSAKVGGGVGAGALTLPFVIAREAVGLVSLAPKVALTAPPYVVGALYGTVHGLRVVRRNRRPQNDATMIELEPLDTIPDERRFVSKDNCVFDIEELVASIEATQSWHNPYTHKAFSRTDIERIINHASDAGAHLRQLANASSEGVQGMSVETVRQLRILARTLATDTNESVGNRASVKAIGKYFAYCDTLSDVERDAVNNAPQLHAVNFTQQLTEVRAGKECIHGLGSSLLGAVEQIERQLPANLRRDPLARYFTT